MKYIIGLLASTGTITILYLFNFFVLRTGEFFIGWCACLTYVTVRDYYENIHSLK